MSATRLTCPARTPEYRRYPAAVRGKRLIATSLTALALAAPACAGDEGPGAPAAVEGGAVAAKLPPLLPRSRGKTFYVAPGGSDSGPGTRARPWRSVQKALSTLRPGQRVLVRRGTYIHDHVLERAGARTAPITVAAYAYARVQGFVLELAKGKSSTNVYFEGSAHHVELSRNEIRFSQDQGVFAEASTRNLYIVGNRIHDNGRGHVSGQHQSHGLYIEGRDHLIANNVVYDHPFGFGIQIYPENEGTTVVSNTVVGSGYSGIVVGGDDGVGDITIRNNVIAFNARYGVQMDSDCPTGPVAIDRNVISGNGDGAVQGGCSRVNTSGGNVTSDPRFVSRAGRNFQLRPGSPAINRAHPDFSLRIDARGRRRPRAGGYDVGAYER
jgi:hypothetical protein